MHGRIVFLGRTIPPCAAQTIRDNTRRGMLSSAVALQEKLLDGFDALCGENVALCNVEAIESFPQHYRRAWIPAFRFSHRGEEAQRDYNVSFNNTFGIRLRSMERGLERGLRALDREQETGAIVIYSPTTYFLNAALRFQKRRPGVRLCLIIPDLPDFGTLAQHVPLKSRVYRALQNRSLRRALTRLDSLVVLTEQTADYLGWKGKYAVVEGIAKAPEAVRRDTEETTIVYTGTTHARFGLPVLVEAMSYLPRQDIRLVVCGCGDYDEALRRHAAQDSRISFLGVVPHDRALQLQMDAAVLVNPRQNEGEYTKYSFPSKTMEYLCTGNPVVAYPLDGVPAEYAPFLHSPADNTPQALAEEIRRLLALPPGERLAQGQAAREYVLAHKGAAAQVKKILDLLE